MNGSNTMSESVHDREIKIVLILTYVCRVLPKNHVRANVLIPLSTFWRENKPLSHTHAHHACSTCHVPQATATTSLPNQACRNAVGRRRSSSTLALVLLVLTAAVDAPANLIIRYNSSQHRRSSTHHATATAAIGILQSGN